MTIRLLSTFDGCAPNSIITLDAANEAGMVTAKTASFDLTGGTPFVPKAGPLEVITGSFTVRARRARIVALPEGKALKVTGNAGAVGEVTRVDSLDKWTIGANALPPIGPFSGAQKVLVSCIAGSIDAVVGDAVVGVAMPVRSPTGAVAGLSAPNSPILMLPQARPRKGTVLIDFSDTANWLSQSGGVQRSADPLMAKLSAAAIKLAFNSGAASDGIKKIFATPFFIQNGTGMKLVTYIDPDTYGSTTATVKFSSAAVVGDVAATTAAVAAKNISYTITNAYLRPGWSPVPIRAGEDGTFEPQAGTTWTSVGGQAWGDAFNYVEIVFNGLAGKTCWVDSLLVGSKSTPFWTFSTDSPDASILDVIAPAFAANNWTGTAFIDGDASVVNAFKGTLKILIDKYGWEPGCQGKGHTDYTTNGRDIGADYDECVANFLAAGLPAPKQFAYPQNKSSAALDKVLAARGVIWRRGNGNPTMQNAGFGCPNLPDNMVDRKSVV